MNDYDLVIIGGTIAAHQAALNATQLHAKVALIEPKINQDLNFYHLLTQNLGNHSTTISPEKSLTPDWKNTISYTHSVSNNLRDFNSSKVKFSISVSLNSSFLYLKLILIKITSLEKYFHT